MEALYSYPPLPESYYNTYRQYKHAHSRILHWVQKTAADLRDRIRTPSSPTRGRAQGKSKNGTKRSQPIPDLDYETPKLSLRTFLKLVRDIADSDVEIPQNYIVLLEMSIKQRKDIAAFYSPDANASESNKAHLF